MEKEFIPYEQALELKELGFDEPCFAWYVSESYGLEYGEVIKSDLIRDGIVAPTYSQAFRWFREKYGLEIVFRPDSFNDESKKLREYVIISYDKTWKLEEILEPSHWIRKGCFKTYEEAELACLKKLIEIVKEKS
jgi:hypothetical protein